LIKGKRKCLEKYSKRHDAKIFGDGKLYLRSNTTFPEKKTLPGIATPLALFSIKNLICP
jgi:hypothetical protein